MTSPDPTPGAPVPGGQQPAGEPRTVLPTEPGGTPSGGHTDAGAHSPKSFSPKSPSPGGPSSRSGKRDHLPFGVELTGLVLIAVLLALVIKAFVVQAFYIPSGSMQQTLHINDRVLVNKIVYRIHDVRRGDIVVFSGKGSRFSTIFEAPPTTASNPVSRGVQDVQRWLGLGAPGENDFIKRVIGVGGDTVACCDTQGRVTVNGKPLTEPYIYQNSPLGQARSFGPVKVPAGRLFVMGDHRGDSSDSRVNGTIPESSVVGRAFVRVWPLNRFAFLSDATPWAVAGAILVGVAVLGTISYTLRRSGPGG